MLSIAVNPILYGTHHCFHWSVISLITHSNQLLTKAFHSKHFWAKTSRRVSRRRSRAPPAKRWTPSCTWRTASSPSRLVARPKPTPRRPRTTRRTERPRASATSCFTRAMSNSTMSSTCPQASLWPRGRSAWPPTTRKAYSKITVIMSRITPIKKFKALVVNGFRLTLTNYRFPNYTKFKPLVGWPQTSIRSQHKWPIVRSKQILTRIIFNRRHRPPLECKLNTLKPNTASKNPTTHQRTTSGFERFKGINRPLLLLVLPEV